MSDGGVHPHDMPDELDAFLDDLRSAASAAPTPVVGDALATLFREGTVPMPAPAAPHRRRVAVRATVAGLVAGLAFGGLGVAGALPGPVQRRVADVADHVGVHLPDDRPAPTSTTTSTSTSTTSTPARPGAVPTTRPATPPTPPTTVEDHGGGRGRGGDKGKGGDDHGKADDPHGKAEDSHGRSDVAPGRATVTTVADDGEGSGEDESSGKGRSGRIPPASDGVHVDDGSHSGHDDGGTQ